MENIFTKTKILNEINKIRNEIGHEITRINIHSIEYNENELWIIAEDRNDKSAIIGKGGWVVGKLREKLKINKIHVYSYEDYLIKEYKLKLSLKKTNEYKNKLKGIENLNKLIENKIKHIYNFNLKKYFKENKFDEINEKSIVAYSGGVDSSFSLIIAKQLGLNPIAISIDPGSIILPNQFKKNIENLCKKLDIEQKYIEIDSSEIINDSLNGKYHPCGRCSKLIEENIYKYAEKNNINIIIYGDMLSSGNQCIIKKNNIYRLNLPASLACQKEEMKEYTNDYNLIKFKGFGCPLLYEVHRKYPHLKKFSIQRILRETRAQSLESGEALNLIWSFYK